MPKQNGEIVTLGINYSETLKQQLDTERKGNIPSPSTKKEQDEDQTNPEDEFKGMMSLF